MEQIVKYNKVWTQEEEDLLLTMKDQGYTEPEICKVLGRTRGSITHRLWRLGYYKGAHTYTPCELLSERPVSLPADEAMRAAYRMLGIRDFEYNPSGERVDLPITA